MATFIPDKPYITKSNGAEQRFFYILKEKLTIPGAYVFHSIGLPVYKDKIFGEADFVIVCKRGVLCLEVKGGTVKYRNGQFLYWNSKGEYLENEHKDPFKQANDNITAIRKTIIDNVLAVNSKCSFAHGVVFPDIVFDISTIQYDKRLVFDQNTDNVNQYIHDLYDLDYSNNNHKKPLSESQIEALVSFIRPNFTFVETLRSKLGKIETEMIRFTETQRLIMQSHRNNPQLAVRGGAGTGKTLMAQEFAKQKAAEGKKVLFLVYNRIIAGDIAAALADVPNIDITHLHAKLPEIVAFSDEIEKIEKDNYYKKIWPKLCAEAIQKMSAEEKAALEYDYMIIDEAQDILVENFKVILDSYVKGGFKNGNWAIFYDAEQNIYALPRKTPDEVTDFENMLKWLSANTGVKYCDLDINCRNTKAIAEFNAKVTQTPLSDTLMSDYGEEVKILVYGNDEELKSHMDSLYGRWEKDGVNKSSIAFLSFKNFENSDLHRVYGSPENAGMELLLPNHVYTKEIPVFCTVYSFKGLDSPIVVLADSEAKPFYEDMQLLYTGISRANAKLYLLMRQDTYENMKEVLQ
ncbi:MAG: NERD domain-containing protein [Firmicutes bacterium]|nr:NERD domain-containing protein [Bacillota bacterium]